MPYGANMTTNNSHLTDSPVIKNIKPAAAIAVSAPYISPLRLQAENMQNAAKYNGIKLSGKYAVMTHIITASAVHTAAVVSFFACPVISSNAWRYTDSR